MDDGEPCGHQCLGLLHIHLRVALTGWTRQKGRQIRILKYGLKFELRHYTIPMRNPV